MQTFIETGLQENILQAIQDLGYEIPTPIQVKTISHLLQTEQDLMALAQTGTGKTAAFGLPTLQKVEPNSKETQVLILAPTRELALQITADMQKFAKYIKGIKVVPVYGGASIENQIKDLRKGAQIVVATPGRAKDLLQRGRLKVDNINTLILDEADEMLTMGFKDELDAILARTPQDKQTLLFSATMSKEVERISKNYMHQPDKISVAAENKGADTVEHIYHMVNAKHRYEVLKRIADMNPDIYGIVFCRTRRETKEVASKLMNDGYNADALHGDMSQSQRDDVMKRFRSKQLQLLVATDVAARGLDVNNLTHVINYNLPDQTEYYTHRSGRTGRAGNKGKSIAIIHTREKNKLRDIERVSKIKFAQQPVPTGEEICSNQLLNLTDKVVNMQVNDHQIEPFLEDIYHKFEHLSKEEVIKHFVSAEFNRFLNYYKKAKDINVTDTKKDKKSVSERRSNTNFTRLFLNVGKKENLTPLRLIGIVNNALDSGNAEIGKIEILKNFSFFEIENKAAEKLASAIKSQTFEGRDLSVEIANARNGDDKSNSKDKKRKRDRKKGGKGRDRQRQRY
jgi:ATP-dependent RNA helicase DeaD